MAPKSEETSPPPPYEATPAEESSITSLQRQDSSPSSGIHICGDNLQFPTSHSTTLHFLSQFLLYTTSMYIPLSLQDFYLFTLALPSWCGVEPTNHKCIGLAQVL